MGLVNRIVDSGALLDAAVAYADDLATYCAPMSMAVMKEQVRRAMDCSFATSCEEAEELMLEAFHRSDLDEGVASYIERRLPAFSPLPARR